VPSQFDLHQNFPNPFNPSTVISYSLPVASQAVLKVFDQLGKEVTTLVDEVIPAGEHTVHFDATGLPSGVYYYRLKSGGFSQTKKMILTK
jgi:hypothetical protein